MGGIDGDTNPRIARSGAELIDAATALLVEGGPGPVTVDSATEVTELDHDHKMSVLGSVLAWGVTEGRIPDDLVPFSIVVGAGDIAEVSAFASDRFLESFGRTERVVR